MDTRNPTAVLMRASPGNGRSHGRCDEERETWDLPGWQRSRRRARFAGRNPLLRQPGDLDGSRSVALRPPIARGLPFSGRDLRRRSLALAGRSSSKGDHECPDADPTLANEL